MQAECRPAIPDLDCRRRTAPLREIYLLLMPALLMDAGGLQARHPRRRASVVPMAELMMNDAKDQEQNKIDRSADARAAQARGRLGVGNTSSVRIM